MFEKSILNPKNTNPERLLVVRFSSFGDIVQASSVPAAFKSAFPNASIDWLVRTDFKGLLESHPLIRQVIAFDRRAGLAGLLRLAWRLGGEDYTHIYDAHNNMRSRIALSVMRLRRFGRFALGRGPLPRVLTRSKNRLRRFLFFTLHLRSALPVPFRGIHSFLEPLRPWGLATQSSPPPTPQFFIATDAKQTGGKALGELGPPDVALIPSAAWEMKRWPVHSWKQLIALLPELRFVILGGPEDHFCADLAAVDPSRVLNLAGRLSLQGSAAVVEKTRLIVSGDTGLLHVADQLGRPTLALIGPTAFGYPSHSSSEVVEVSLECKPCSKDGRGRCRNAIYQKCLTAITPEQVAARIRDRLRQEETLA